jgi:nucleotide-binding universal stress UspA family protein
VLENALVALDGSALAERVLGPALDLVRLVQGRCTLLRVAEVTQEAEARAYLEKTARPLRGEGIAVETRVVVAPRAAEAILEEADKQRCGVIALATHGRGGVRRMLLGSVADEVIHGAATPVLVYRPPADSTA